MAMETPCCPKSLYAGLPAPQISPVAVASVIPSITLFKFKTRPFDRLRKRRSQHALRAQGPAMRSAASRFALVPSAALCGPARRPCVFQLKTRKFCP